MMTGQVFVIHGSLLDLYADAVLIPCDVVGDVSEHWGRFFVEGAAAVELAREVRGGWVSSVRRSADGQAFLYVDTGATRETANRQWLAERVGAGLSVAAADLGARACVTGRPRPLVAVPMFGTGAGGFDEIRGEALRAMLEQARSVAVSAGLDVVIVCWHRSDYAAVQRQRTDDHWDWSATPHLGGSAQELAQQIIQERLVLFFGAGVSRAAGLNDFEELVASLEDGFQRKPPPGLGLPGRVQWLRDKRGDELKDRVRDQLERHRYSLTHGLLASFRIREAITTNFDQLYELAAARPFAAEPNEAHLNLDVYPWDRTSAARPWLLKAHGDAWRDGDLVFSADEYAEFRRAHGPVASVLQSMFALSREVLFVGYSLRDENVRSLMDEAAKYHASRHVEHRRLGTVLDLGRTGRDVDEQLATVGFRLNDEPFPEAARRLEVFLDYLGWLASEAEASWLLDPRYEGLLEGDDERHAAQQLRTLAVPGSPVWAPVRRRLREFGRP